MKNIHYAAHLLDLGFGNYFFHDLFLTLVFFCSLNKGIKLIIYYQNTIILIKKKFFCAKLVLNGPEM